MGNQLFLLALSLSLSGSIIMGLIFLVKAVTKNNFSKKWQYYVWILVIARLLIPVSLEWNIVGSLFDWNRDSSIVQSKQERNAATNPSDNSEIDRTQVPNGTEEQTDIALDSVKGSAIEWNDLYENIWMVWVFGIILSLTIRIVDYRNFNRYLNLNNKEITDKKILAVMDDVMTDLKIKRDITLYSNELAVSPMLIGGIHAGIVLPLERISTTHLSYVLMHELTHYKRGDIWYKWLLQFSMCIHWYNPLLFLINKDINRTCELSCDESVMRHLNQNERKEYGNMLLDVADIGIQYKNQVLSMTLIENKKNLKERLFSIIRYKRNARWMTICSALILCLLCMSTLTVGGMTLELYKDKENENSEQITEDRQKNLQDSKSIESKSVDSKSIEETDSDTFLNEDSYLKGSMLENIIMDMLIKGAELSDSDLSSILPFVGDDFSDMLIEVVKSGKNFSMSQLVIMAPFVTEECVDEIIYGEIEQQIEIKKEDLFTLLPFASENALELLLQAVFKNGNSMDLDLQDLITVAPFVDSDTLSQCVTQYLADGGLLSEKSITDLACFLEEDVLGEIMRLKVEESPEEVLRLLQNVAYAMDSTDIKDILVEIMNLGIELKIYNVESFYIYLDDNDFRDIIDVMRKKNLATQKEVERFYEQYDL